MMAEHDFARGKRATLARLVLSPAWRFWRGYVLRGGFLDGWHGLVYAYVRANSGNLVIGSGWRLFFRGVLFWLVVVGPLAFGALVAISAVDWTALGRGGGDVMSRIETAGIGPAVVVAVLSVGWSIVAVAVLYPAFQAMVLRWWISGLRFGELTVASNLRRRAVYAVYLRFMWIALIAGVVFAIGAAIAFAIAGGLTPWLGKGVMTELLSTALLIGSYVIVALAYSTIYQATVRLRLWKAGFESIELSGLEALDRVNAAGAAGSAVGEGLADALNVGGI